MFESGTLKILFFAQLVCCVTATGWSQDLNLKVAGNASEGFGVDVYDGDRILIENTGEFSLRVANLDLSETIDIRAWRGSEWSGDNNRIQLFRTSYVPELDLNLTASISYKVVNRNIIEKRISLFQSGMPSLYYTIDQKTEPAEAPLKYVTFEHDNFPGGLAHEIFPSAGFLTPDSLLVGLLMDAGYRNHYTRTTRRRFNGHGGGFVGMRKLPDPALVSIATLSEREVGQHYIKQTFGEMYDLDAGTSVRLHIDDDFNSVGEVQVAWEADLITLECSPSDRAGIEMLVPFEDQKVYTISFYAKGDTPVALKLFRLKSGRKTFELEHGVKYIDRFPVDESEWTLFQGSIFVPYIENDSVSMFIGSQSGQSCRLDIRELQIIEHQPQEHPYNVIPMGDTVTKTTYIFVEPWTGHRDFVISSQSRLAEAMGFEGTLIEKMVYANLNMLTWITSIHDITPFNVPNMNYSPDMYNRDAFFSITSTYNKDLNLKIWEQWGKTQTDKGAVGTIITPYMGSVEVKDNEATIQWLIWAMLNRRRFGVTLPEEKIRRAVNYVLDEFDEDRDGICESHFTLSQVDIIDYHPKTDRLGVNQGMFAIALRTIRELGFDISDAYLDQAEMAYRDFYDERRGHILFDRNYPEIVSLTDLEPEFFSLWLFDRPMLTDTMVINHLDKVPVLNKVPNSPHPEYGTTAPICIRVTEDERGYAYMSSDYQPFGEFGEKGYANGARDGFYYNGGSWLRAEYCAYAVGKRHGWNKADIYMENRTWAEIHLNPDWPYSKEFIPTKWTSTDTWWRSTRGLCWNAFVLMANEVAGLRTPDQDPDYGKFMMRQ